MDINSIKSALKNNELIFFYQPKVSFISGKIIGAEALIRWRRNDGAIIPPSEFIPLAESTGFITEITTSMFPRLINEFQRFRSLSENFQIAFNISAKDLKTPRLLLLLREAISTGLIGQKEIQFEITESTIIKKEQSVKKSLAGLVSAGVDIVMDDFGTGYSSLDVFSRLPFKELKVEQGLLKRCSISDRSDIILRATIAMASFLGIKTIVEGIETEHEYSSMQQLGCYACQGYYISPPIPMDDILNMIKSNPQWPSSYGGLFKMSFFAHSWYMKLFFDWLFVIQNKRDKQVCIEAERLRIDHTQCLFGKWHSENNKFISDCEHFVAISENHRKMHEVCNLIIDSMINEKGQDKINESLEQLNKLYCKLAGEYMEVMKHLFGNK